MKFYTSVSYFIKNLLKSIRIYLFYTRSVCVHTRARVCELDLIPPHRAFQLLSSVQLDGLGL